MPVEKYNISMAPENHAAIEARGAAQFGLRSATINTSLERYFAVLAATRRNLVQQFSDGEIGAMLDACNGTLFGNPHSIRLLWANIEDSVPDGIEAKWGIDASALAQRLRGLSYAENVTLVDAIEQWWHRVAGGETPDATVAEVLGS